MGDGGWGVGGGGWGAVGTWVHQKHAWKGWVSPLLRMTAPGSTDATGVPLSTAIPEPQTAPGSAWGSGGRSGQDPTSFLEDSGEDLGGSGGVGGQQPAACEESEGGHGGDAAGSLGRGEEMGIRVRV